MNTILSFIIALSSISSTNPQTDQSYYPTLKDIEKISLGEWETEGTTSDIWEGIKPGTKYTSYSSTQWSDDMSSFIGYYRMTTEKGTLISTGTSITTTNSNGKNIGVSKGDI